MGEFIVHLTQRYKSGNSVRGVITATRAALPHDVRHVFDAPIIQDALRKCVRSKVPLPSVPPVIWDPDKVLQFFRQWPQNSELGPVELSGKCLVLLMLASGRRKSDLHKLSVNENFMVYTSEKIYFACSSFTKGHRRVKSHDFMQFIEFQKFDLDPQCCPYSVIMSYLDRIRTPRRPQCDNFFVTTDKGTPAHPDTLKRWALNILQAAGIDVTMYKTNSIRSAHSSKSYQLGESIDSIMDRCAWVRGSTFVDYYLRPIDDSGPPPTTLPEIERRNAGKLFYTYQRDKPFSRFELPPEAVPDYSSNPLPFNRRIKIVSVSDPTAAVQPPPAPPTVLNFGSLAAPDRPVSAPPGEDIMSQAPQAPAGLAATPTASPAPSVSSTPTDNATKLVHTLLTLPDSPLSSQGTTSMLLQPSVIQSSPPVAFQVFSPVTISGETPSAPSVGSHPVSLPAKPPLKPPPAVTTSAAPLRTPPLVSLLNSNTKVCELLAANRSILPMPRTVHVPQVPAPHEVVTSPGFMQSASGTASVTPPSASPIATKRIRDFFPTVKANRLLLFGVNFNYFHPIPESVSPRSFLGHFVALSITPFTIGVIVDAFNGPDSVDHVAITINDSPFRAQRVGFDYLYSL